MFLLCNAPQPPQMYFYEKKMVYTTGENFAIIDEHPIGGGGVVGTP